MKFGMKFLSLLFVSGVDKFYITRFDGFYALP